MKQVMESTTETLEHIRFQLDLLNLTSMPIELTGPSVMQDVKTQKEAVRAVHELQIAAKSTKSA